MKDAAATTSGQTIYLDDYTAPGWLVEEVHLTFRLAPEATRVLSKVRFVPNPDAPQGQFYLHGEQLSLIGASIDGTPVSPEVTEDGLTCDVPSGAFTWEAEVELAPAKNFALDGTTLGPSLPISLPWSQAIWSRMRINSPPHPAAMLPSISGCVRGTRANAPLAWRR